MDDFGDSFVQPEVDPAAEFLAREQNQLAGLEDELETSAPPPIAAPASNGLEDFVEVPSAAVFEANGLIDAEPAPTSVFRQEREEPEKIRIWREEQKKRLTEKDEEEERKKEEMLKVAKKELEDWYKTHEEQIAKTKAANRESAKNAERALARGSEGGSTEGGEWARVAELCDFGPRRGRDVARLRSIVLQLKQAGSRPKYPPRTTKVFPHDVYLHRPAQGKSAFNIDNKELENSLVSALGLNSGSRRVDRVEGELKASARQQDYHGPKAKSYMLRGLNFWTGNEGALLEA